MGHTPLEGSCPYQFALLLLCGSLQLSRTHRCKRDGHRGLRRQRTYRREPGKPGASTLPQPNGGRLTADGSRRPASAAHGKHQDEECALCLQQSKLPSHTGAPQAHHATREAGSALLCPCPPFPPPQFSTKSEVTAAHISTQIHQRHLSLTMAVEGPPQMRH